MAYANEKRSSYFSRLPIQKLVYGFLILSIFIPSLLVLIVLLLFRAVDQSTDERQQLRITDRAIQVLVYHLVDVQIGARGYAITGEEKFLQPYTKAVNEYDETAGKARELVKKHPQYGSRFDQLEELGQRSLQFSQRIIALRKGQNAEAAHKLISTGKGKEIMDQIRALGISLNADILDAVDQHDSQAMFYENTVQLTIVVGCLLLWVFGVLGIFSVKNSFSVQKRLEEEISAAMEKLEISNKELEAFSYSVSHDLRSPLRHIIGFIHLLQQSSTGCLDEDGKRYLDIISQASKHMGQLIDDLLMFSRMGRAEMRLSPVSLGQLVQAVQADFKADCVNRNIAWKIGSLPEVLADPAMLRLALTNLISNAVKYTMKQEKAQIEIGTIAQTSGEVVVFVRDNGVGFDMRYADKLFGVFQRLHREEDFEGTGIGLANVRRIINRHGGRTWAEGVVDQGAVFYFSLPAPSANFNSNTKG